MASDVVFTMTGDEAKALRAAERAMQKMIEMGQKVDQLNAKQKQTTQATEETGISVDKVWAGFQRLAGAAGISVGIASAIGLINRQLQETLRLQEEAAQTQVTLASAQRDLVRNLPGRSAADVNRTLTAAGTIARDTGVSEVIINQALASAVSASGGAIDPSIAAVRQSAMFLADKPDAIAEFAGALLDIGKVTGRPDDALVNQGLLTFVGAMSRVVDPGRMAKNIPRALIGASKFGATPQQAAALFAVQTVGAADITGEMSGTAVISLVQQMEEFFKGGGGDFGQRLAALHADPRLAQRFLKGASFERTSVGPIRELISDPNSPMARLFRENLATMPAELGDLGGVAGAHLAALQGGRFEPIAEFARLGAVTKESLESVSPGAAIAEMKKAVRGALAQAGVGIYGLFEAGQGMTPTLMVPEDQRILLAAQSGIQALENRARRDPDDAVMLRELADGIRNLIERLELNSAATEANTEATQGRLAPRPRADNAPAVTVP